MKERRTLERRHIMFYSRVFDRRTGGLLGYLGNLTVEGAMIISEQPRKTNEDYLIRMDLPEDMYSKTVLNLEAHGIWCETDIDPNFYNIGFKLIDVSDEDKAIIEQIIIDYGFDGNR